MDCSLCQNGDLVSVEANIIFAKKVRNDGAMEKAGKSKRLGPSQLKRIMMDTSNFN